MKPARVRREGGAALLALLAVLMLGASWFLVSKLRAETGGMTAVNRAHNAAVLNRAKQALIAYVAIQAAAAGENNPGRLPCPELAGYVGTTSEGIAPSTGIPPSLPTPATFTCTSIGRLPWRTLGLEKLVDASGEPLWYVVGPAWRLATETTTLVINSNTAGDVTVDGEQVVALIIAPGPAINAQAATGCTARNQTRSAPSSSINYADYIECFNSATLQFVTTAAVTPDGKDGSSPPRYVYNDQVVRITVGDIMPAIEGAIANRIEREIVPALKSVYTPATWGVTGSNPVMPYAATFGNPGTGAGTSDYRGILDTYEGLLPFNQTQGCTESAADPRCTKSFLSWSSSGPVQVSGGGSLRSGESGFPNTCSWKSTDVYSCVGAYNLPTVTLNLTVAVTNVAMGLRKIDLSKLTFTAANDVACSPCTGTTSIPYTASVTLNADGSATINIAGTALPDVAGAGWGTWASYTISFDRGFIGDHDLLSTTDGTTGWFARNEWYRLTYYAVAKSNATRRTSLISNLSTERSCNPYSLPTYPYGVGDCLTVTSSSGSESKSAVLILAGRSLNGRARPSATRADYFEFGNAKPTPTFERQTVTPPLAVMYVDTGSANTYFVPVASLATGSVFQFRAANANTGPSTLTTTAFSARGLVNADGSSLTAATIQANAVVQVTWDGSRFLLSKRPFNDRIAAIASN